MADLDPITPETALSMYLDGRQGDLTEATLRAQRYRLDAFLQWCDESELDDLNELTGRHVYEYRVWRREGHGEGRDKIKRVTLRGQLGTLRAFLRFCGEIEAVPPELYKRVDIPTISAGLEVSDSTLEPDRVMEILGYLEEYYYASRDHLTILLLWHTGCRIGSLLALDVDDVDHDAHHPRVDGPALQFVHRPETGTPLKNKERGERWNRISPFVSTVIQDYVDGQRAPVKDDFGRNPLLTTFHGRPSPSTIRDSLYRATRPCWRGLECPHDRELDDCEATALERAARCPSSRSPHDLRSGRVTYYRRNDVPRRIVEDRLNASEDILDKHYDRRGEREKAQQRSDYLPDI